MKKITQHSFLGGQLDWEMMGRQDVEKYQKGATLLKNVVLHKRGAAFKRPGTNHLWSVTDIIADGKYRLVPFASTQTQGWALLFTSSAIYAVSTLGVQSVTTPVGFSSYSGDEVDELDYCQCGDIVYVAHRNHPPCMIKHTVSGTTHAFELFVIDLKQQAQGVPTVTGATVTKTGITTKGPSYTEEYKVTGVYEGVETFPSAAYSNANCQDYDSNYAVIQSKNATRIAWGGAATDIYIAPKMSYAGTAYTLPWTESQKITLDIRIPTRSDGKRPEQVRIYRKTGSFFGLVGLFDATAKWSDASSANTVSATSTRIQYNGTSSKGNLMNAEKLECERYGLGVDGFTVTGNLTLELGSAANKATVDLKVGHIAYVESSVVGSFPEFDATATYNTGDTCSHSGKKYVCKYDGTTGEWDADNWSRTSFTTLLTRTYTYRPCGAGTFTVQLGSGTAQTVSCTSASESQTKTMTQTGLESQSEFRSRAASEAASWANAISDTDGISVEVRADTASATLVISPNASSFVMYNVTVTHCASEAFPSSMTWEDKYYTPDVSVTPPCEADVMSAAGDYPGCVCLSQQRLIWASTANDPSRVFMSEIGALYTYSPHDVQIADDPIDFQVSATQFPKINHIVELKKIVMFNGASEWIVDSASTNQGITYETIRATQHSCIGSSPSLKPIVCNNVLLFAERTGQAVRQYDYSLEDNGYGGNDISIFSQSIFNEKKIVAWAYQQHPHSTCWCVLSDGTMASLTFNIEQQCIAWSTHALGGGGLARDIVCTQALVGNGSSIRDTSEMLILVQRGSGYAIEQFRPESNDTSDTPEHFTCMDGCVKIAQGATPRSGTTLVNLDTMEIAGSTTAASVNGYMSGYPFDSRITTVYPVVAKDIGLAQIDVKCVQGANLRLMRSVGGMVKSVDAPDSAATHLAKTTFSVGASGTATIQPVDERVLLRGSENRDGRITIFQDTPYPFGVMLVETDLDVEEHK